MKKQNIILIIVFVISVVALLGIDTLNKIKNTQTTGEDDYWKVDKIQLMRHETDGRYGCFGCNEAGKDPAMCVDPIPEMKLVEEVSDRYCNSDFEVVETLNIEQKCLPEQRNVDACIEIYQPVCATVEIQCITTPCNPIQETFPNPCYACKNSLVTSYVEGECQKIKFTD